MTSLRDRTGAPPIGTADGLGPPPATGSGWTNLDPSASKASHDQREIELLALDLRAEHPEVPLVVLVSMVEREYAAFSGARVQGFRMILTERAVRRRLAAGELP